MLNIRWMLKWKNIYITNTLAHHTLISRVTFKWNQRLVGGSFRVTLVVDWWFLPKIFGPWWGPTKAIYRSVNTDRVIILFAEGGNTWTQFSIIELVWTFCTERWWGAKNQIFWSCKSVVQINLYGEFFVGLRQHRKWIWSGDSIWRWWGHLNTI